MNRRQALTEIAGIAGIVLGFSSVPKIFSQESTRIYVERDPDKTFVVKKVEAKSLDALLEEGKTKLPETKTAHVVIKRKPSALYCLSVKQEDEGLVVDKLEAGSAHILNPEGFFLTNYHVVKDHLKRITPRYLLLSDFQTGLVAGAEILAYNPYKDIALGKIEIPENKRRLYRKINLTKKEPEKDEWAGTITFEKPGYVAESYMKIINTLKRDENRRPIPVQERELVEDQNLFFIFSEGRILDEEDYTKKVKEAAEKLKKRPSLPRKGNHLYVSPKTARMRPSANFIWEGNSGSAIYNSNGELDGIIRAIPKAKLTLTLLTVEERKEVAVWPYEFIGPTSIRVFLNDYAISVKDK